MARWKARVELLLSVIELQSEKKNLLSSNTSSTCPDNMVNFGLLTAEIGSGVWGTPTVSTGFASWQRYCTASSSGRPNFAALNRWRHLCSAGRPSGWALAHILVLFFYVQNMIILSTKILRWVEVCACSEIKPVSRYTVNRMRQKTTIAFLQRWIFNNNAGYSTTARRTGRNKNRHNSVRGCTDY